MSNKKNSLNQDPFENTRDIYEEIYEEMYEDGGENDSKKEKKNDDDKHLYDIRI